MTVYGRILLAGFGSFLLLAGALLFQYVGGLAPCELCIWQRWPHLAGIVLAALAVSVLWRLHKVLAWAGGAALLAGAGIAAFHAGVEQHWWTGPGACSAPLPAPGLGTAELLDRIMAAPLVRCDEIPWDFLGLSMAAWNGLLSLLLAVLWLWPMRALQPSSSASQ